MTRNRMHIRCNSHPESMISILATDSSFENTQWTHDEIMTSLLRQNNVVTSFWRYNDVIIMSCITNVMAFMTYIWSPELVM